MSQPGKQKITQKVYSAVVDSKNRISVFDAESGVRAYSINLGAVEIVNGPVVTYDKLTIVVKDKAGRTSGKVYSLKTGVLSYSFNISANK